MRILKEPVSDLSGNKIERIFELEKVDIEVCFFLFGE